MALDIALFYEFVGYAIHVICEVAVTVSLAGVSLAGTRIQTELPFRHSSRQKLRNLVKFYTFIYLLFPDMPAAGTPGAGVLLTHPACYSYHVVVCFLLLRRYEDGVLQIRMLRSAPAKRPKLHAFR